MNMQIWSSFKFNYHCYNYCYSCIIELLTSQNSFSKYSGHTIKINRCLITLCRWIMFSMKRLPMCSSLPICFLLLFTCYKLYSVLYSNVINYVQCWECLSLFKGEVHADVTDVTDVTSVLIEAGSLIEEYIGESLSKD